MSYRRSGNSRRQQSVDFPRYPPISQPPGSAPAQPPPPPPAVVASIPDALATAAAAAPVPGSDYESDYQGYQSDYPTKPPPPNRTNEELNLSVLKRHNPEISSILSIAPYAVVYEFSPLPQPEWTKTGVEGSLFICELTPGSLGEDRYVAIVLNRRGLDNFEAELREGENAGVEITGEYVIVSFKQGHEQKIYGVYIFHDVSGSSTEHAQTLNGELMKSLADHAGASRQAAGAAASAAQQRHTNGHIREAEHTIHHQQPDTRHNPGQSISLQQLFGQQRAADAAWSVQAHNHGGAAGMHQPSAGVAGVAGRPTAFASVVPNVHQPDILGDLFRRAGLGTQ